MADDKSPNVATALNQPSFGQSIFVREIRTWLVFSGRGIASQPGCSPATMAAVQPHYSHETCRINVSVIYERASPVLNNISALPCPQALIHVVFGKDFTSVFPIDAISRRTIFLTLFVRNQVTRIEVFIKFLLPCRWTIYSHARNVEFR